MLGDAGTDQLSRAEERLIDEVFQENRQFNQWQLRAKSHELPEWQDPEGGRRPIEIEAILTAMGRKVSEASELASELRGMRKMQALSAD